MPSPSDGTKQACLRHELQAVAAVENEMDKIFAFLDRQTEFAHRYWSASAEDVAASSRDWAAIHSAIRSRIGMQYSGVPSVSDFETRHRSNVTEQGPGVVKGRQ